MANGVVGSAHVGSRSGLVLPTAVGRSGFVLSIAMDRTGLVHRASMVMHRSTPPYQLKMRSSEFNLLRVPRARNNWGNGHCDVG